MPIFVLLWWNSVYFQLAHFVQSKFKMNLILFEASLQCKFFRTSFTAFCFKDTGHYLHLKLNLWKITYILENNVTSEGAVSHSVLHHQPLPITRYQVRFYANNYFEELPIVSTAFK